MSMTKALSRSAGIITCGGLLSAAAVAQQPSHAFDYAVFGGQGVVSTSASTIIGAPVGSNGDISHDGNVFNAPGLYGGGDFGRGPASVTNISGDVVFGGTITNLGGPGAVVTGNVDAGGDIYLSSSIGIQGNVTAGGDYDSGSFADIAGNLRAGGHVDVRGLASVAGDLDVIGDAYIGSSVAGHVTHGGTLTVGPGGSVGSSGFGIPIITPKPYKPVALPAPTPFSACGASIDLCTFDDRVIAPGSYGSLICEGANDIYLSAGHYYFDAIVGNGPYLNIHYDTTGGPIRVFVADSATIVHGDVFVNGAAFDDVPIDQALNIHWQVDGSFVGDTDFIGTLYTPFGDASFNTFSEVVGAVVAGGTVYLGNADVTFVPEPGALALLGVGVVIGLRRRR